MTDFEMFLCCLLVPVAYVLIYIAGKYDLIMLICKMLQEYCEKYSDKEGDPDGS